MADWFFTDYDTYRDLYDAVASTWVVEATEDGARVASVGTAAPEYRIAVLRDNEEMDEVYATDWQDEQEATFPPLDSGEYIVTVEARPRDDDNAESKGNWEVLHVD
jgi:hypothetical protein